MFDMEPRRIVFYGRVSTEHEAQLSALENQMQWYDDQLERHKEWTLVNKYIDRGITGTQAKKRPAFMQMMKDAEKSEFDLIVTREVCRFARNTVDTLEYTRKLKKKGIEVYFVEDNIWTFSGDGELRLTIMAAMAQEESRKVSERVCAGQKISRDNGVLYGSGNILGYDLKRNIGADGKWNPVENTYVVNPEQAETVRMIYDMCIAGDGYLKICKALTNLGRKDATGKVKWSSAKIGRILHNKTYAGYKCYNKSHTDDYLEHSRVKNLDKLRLSTLLEMRMDNEITKEEYQSAKAELETEIVMLQEQLESVEEIREVVESLDDKLKIIRSFLEEQIDFSGNVVSHDIIEKVVAQVIPMSNNKFKWILNLLGDNHAVAAYLEGRKNNPSFKGGSAKDLEFFRPSTGCDC